MKNRPRTTVLVALLVLALLDRPLPAGPRYLLFMRTPEGRFNQALPERINEAAFAETMDHFRDLPESDVRLGLACIFSYFRTDMARVKASLRNFLTAAERTNTPILIKLDGEQWWQARPDLWNWWDPDMPGYSPDNARNVEWTGWSPDEAVKIAWRNWGRQIRVLPPPNLMSPEYRRACHEAMDDLLPIIRGWWLSLPADRRDLLVGINVGWESAIGINAYHYPGGNSLLDQPPEKDPTSGIDMADVPSRGLVQLGYAAVSSAGIRTGGQITEADLTEVVRRHLEDLSKRVADHGFPREKIYTHTLGNGRGEMLYDAALNRYACPGWSFYHHAADPARDAGVMRALQRTTAPHWAAVEWLLLAPPRTQVWQAALDKTLSHPGCSLLCLYNWESIADKPPVLDAIRNLVTDSRIGVAEEPENK